MGDDCGTLKCNETCDDAGKCLEFFPISVCECGVRGGGDNCELAFCQNNCNLPNGTCNMEEGRCECELGF